MVYIYCRVSTKKQEDNYSFESQKRNGIAFAEELGQPYELYKDVESGKKATRSEWVRLLSDVKSKGTGQDIIWYGSQSRLMRDAGAFQSFKNLCINKRIKVYESRQSKYLDFAASKGDRIAAGVQSIIDEEEVIEIEKRTINELKVSWDLGLRVHTKTYGYDSSEFDSKSGKKVWKIVEKEAEIIRLAVELYLSGEGVRNIARILNEKGYRWRGGKYFTHYEVDLMVSKPIYASLTTDSKGKEIKSVLYPNIIDIEQWQALEKMLPLRHKKGREGRAIQHPLTSVLRCASCGAIYEYAPNTKKQLYYYRHKGPKPADCKGRGSVTEDGAEYIAFEAYVWGILNITGSTLADIKARLLNPEAESDRKRFDSMIEILEKKVASNQAALDLGDNIAYYAKRISESLAELEQLQKQKAKIVHSNEESFEKYREAVQAYGLNNLKEFFQNKNGRFRNGKLKTVIKAILLPKGDEFEIEYLDGRKRTIKYVPHVNKDGLDVVNVIAMEDWDDKLWELFIKAKATGTAALLMSDGKPVSVKIPRITAEEKKTRDDVLRDFGI